MTTAIVTILMFLALVSIHEFGHFIAAKSVGIKVLEFAVGMGPAIWKKQKGETLYSLRVFPIGGYCKMEGEDEESVDSRAYSAQSLWKRMIVVIAGAVLNILLGFFIFIVIVSNTPFFQTNVVDQVVENSYFEQVGIQNGDKIIKINGNKVAFYPDISWQSRQFQKDVPIAITIDRNGENIDFQVTPSIQKITYQYQENGINIIENLNGIEENTFMVYNDEEPALKKDSSKIGKEQVSERLIMGFLPIKQSPTIKTIIPESVRYTKYVVKIVYSSLFEMISGKVSVKQLSGPVGVVNEVNNAVKFGWLPVMELVAVLTINLGVFNLLPLPALDGGRLFFMIIEAIRRKSIPPEKEGIVHTIGFLLLMLLMVVVLFNDISKLGIFSKMFSWFK